MTAFALRELAAPDAQAPMSRALSDPAWQVRLEAVEYFEQLEPPDLVQRLEPRLRDRHVAVRLAAEQALAGR
jgi:HEAT repeat protein